MYTKCERLSVRVNDWTSVIAHGIPNQEGSRLTRACLHAVQISGRVSSWDVFKGGAGGFPLKNE